MVRRRRGRTRDSSSPSIGVRRSGRAWAAIRARISSSGRSRRLTMPHGLDHSESRQDRARDRRGSVYRRAARWRFDGDDHPTSRRSRFMPLDHYVTLGRSGLRVSPFALGAMTFGEDPAAPGAASRSPRRSSRPTSTRRQLRRHRELLHQRPLREDPRRLLRRPSGPARPGRAGVEVLHQPAPRRPQRRRRGPHGDHRPARRDAAPAADRLPRPVLAAQLGPQHPDRGDPAHPRRSGPGRHGPLHRLLQHPRLGDRPGPDDGAAEAAGRR